MAAPWAAFQVTLRSAGRRRRPACLADTPAAGDAFSWRAVVDPRRWPVQRLVGLAVLNGTVAAGIAVGFNPLP
jgi:hypothetical protein